MGSWKNFSNYWVWELHSLQQAAFMRYLVFSTIRHRRPPTAPSLPGWRVRTTSNSILVLQLLMLLTTFTDVTYFRSRQLFAPLRFPVARCSSTPSWLSDSRLSIFGSR